MINGLHLRDFGNHADTRLSFGKLSLLVGRNAAGKTSVLRAIEMASLRSAEDERANAGMERYGRAGERWKMSFNCDSKLANPAYGAAGVFGGNGSRRFLVKKRIDGDGRKFLPDPATSAEGTVVSGSPTGQDATQFLESGGLLDPLRKPWSWQAQFFQLRHDVLAGPSYSEDIEPKLGLNGENLAWSISLLRGERGEVLDDILTALQELVPAFRRLKNRPAPVALLERTNFSFGQQEGELTSPRKVMGQELRFDMASGRDLPASAISAGTLLALATLTILHTLPPDQDCTLLLDDFEQGLHPGAQRQLIRTMKKLQGKRPKLQLILSSHSPYIVDEFAAEDVWVFVPDAEGISRSARLSDHPDAARALEVLTPGEFWGAQGDEWVLPKSVAQAT